MAKAKLVEISNNDPCELCKRRTGDVLNVGEKFRLRDLVVHYYCVLLSNRTPQNGADNEGVRGFLYKDIKKEIARSAHIRCDYCNDKGAAIQCSNSKCKVKFHLTCGLTNNSMSQFQGDFPSFCVRHRPQQTVPSNLLVDARLNPPPCTICMESIDVNSKYEYLWAPCCRKTWYHRPCLQKLALSQASLFKCAVCSNDSKFKGAMVKLGIFVPERDASWELEPQAFQSLLERHSQCDVECVCPYGRKADRVGSRWEVILCSTCAAMGTHIACSKLKFSQVDWECADCAKIPSRAAETVPKDEVPEDESPMDASESSDTESSNETDNSSKEPIPSPVLDVDDTSTDVALPEKEPTPPPTPDVVSPVKEPTPPPAPDFISPIKEAIPSPSPDAPAQNEDIAPVYEVPAVSPVYEEPPASLPPPPQQLLRAIPPADLGGTPISLLEIAGNIYQVEWYTEDYVLLKKSKVLCPVVPLVRKLPSGPSQPTEDPDYLANIPAAPSLPSVAPREPDPGLDSSSWIILDDEDVTSAALPSTSVPSSSLPPNPPAPTNSHFEIVLEDDECDEQASKGNQTGTSVDLKKKTTEPTKPVQQQSEEVVYTIDSDAEMPTPKKKRKKKKKRRRDDEISILDEIAPPKKASLDEPETVIDLE